MTMPVLALGSYPLCLAVSYTHLDVYKRQEVDSVIIDAKSGVSGAGRGVSLENHFAEVNESIKAYKEMCIRDSGKSDHPVSFPARLTSFLPSKYRKRGWSHSF